MSASRQSSSYSCEAADLVRDRPTILSIWNACLSNVSGQEAKYDWFYMRGEAGPPIVSLLRHTASGLPVGVAAAGRRRALWKGHEACIGVLVDLAVLPKHRSLYPALLLQRSMQNAVPGELAAVYGFPNPRAATVFARVGYAQVLVVRRFVRVLRSRPYLERSLAPWAAIPLARILDAVSVVRDRLKFAAPGGPGARWSDRVDPAVDLLWRKSPPGPGPILIRDSAFLRWRFEQMPGKIVRFLNIAGHDGRLTAWFACEGAGDSLLIRDFWTEAGFERIDANALMLLLREARGAGFAAVSVEFGGSERISRALESAGFSERGRRPFFAYFGGEATSGEQNGWYVTNADEDE
jgi:hypothetical protein